MNLTYLYSMVLENRFIKFAKFFIFEADKHAQFEIRVYAEAI